MDKAETVAAMETGEGWDDFSFESPRLVVIAAGTVAVVYTCAGRRGSFSYRAVLTSAYVDRGDGRRLLFHQQTPMPSPGVASPPQGSTVRHR